MEGAVPQFTCPRAGGVKDVPEQCVKDVMELNTLRPGIAPASAGELGRFSDLGNHFKSGQRLSLQNRPTEGARNSDLQASLILQ